MIVGISLAPAIDVTYVVDNLKAGATHRPLEVHRRPGGKTINMARAAATFGAEVVVVAPVSSACIDDFVSNLAEVGVRLIPVEVAMPTRTCVSIACETTGRMTEVYEHPPNLSNDEVDRLGAAVSALLTDDSSGWVTINGSMSPSAAHALHDLLTVPHAQPRWMTAVDTDEPALGAAMANGVDLVKVNRAEASSATGTPKTSSATGLAKGLFERMVLTDPRSACPQGHPYRKRMAVVTDSVHGVAGTDGTRRWELRIPDVDGTFPQGSGDCFLGGMLAALDLGAEMVDALRLGMGAATANALRPGAGTFDVTTARMLSASVALRSRIVG